MKNEKKGKKRKLRFKVLIVLLLSIYLIISSAYYYLNKPLKKITISGNNYLKDNYLINYLDINNESIFKVNKKKVENKLKEIALISDVKITKNYLGILKINIKEDDVLFYNLLNKTLVLSSGKEIEACEFTDAYLGIPTLTNSVPPLIYQEFINKLTRVDKSILKSVSEITYNPSMALDKVVDDKRFSLKMNDGNTVFINTVNIEKFNDYLDIYEGIESVNGNTKGCLYLDSISENNHFNKCDEAEKGDNNASS